MLAYLITCVDLQMMSDVAKYGKKRILMEKLGFASNQERGKYDA